MQTLPATPTPETGKIGGEWPHLAALRVSPSQDMGEATAADWFAACHRLTPRAERTGRWSALLDLGVCTDAEAVAALRELIEWLAAAGFQSTVGIAPSAALAQLVLLSCTPQHPLAVLSPAEMPAFLKRVPVAALLHLHPHELFTPEVVERLQRYGLRTLGHVARIDELALRRQFGAAGTFLAALAQGRDARPLCPTPLPPELRIRARFATPVTLGELHETLPRLAERAAERLRMQGRRARALRIVVRWESGAVQRSRLTLRQYSDNATLLAQELRRMVARDQPANQFAPEWRSATKSACADSDTDSYADSDLPRGTGVHRTPLHMPANGWHRGTKVPVHGLGGLKSAESRVDNLDAADVDTETTYRDRVEELRLTLSDFAPAAPDQATFWRTHAQQVAAIAQVAETLERRHGHPLLLRPQLATPAAVFAEERYRFAPPDVMESGESVGTADVADVRARRMRRRGPQADVSEVSDSGDADGGDDAWRDVPQRVHWW